MRAPEQTAAISLIPFIVVHSPLTTRRFSLCLLDIVSFPFTHRMSCSTVVYIVLVSECNLYRTVLENLSPAFKPKPLSCHPRSSPLACCHSESPTALLLKPSRSPFAD